MSFPVFARGIQPNGPYKNGPGEINVPIACGGQVVMPGDIVVGDADGLIAIPAGEAAALTEKAEATLQFEDGLLQKYCSGEAKPGTKKWVEDKLLQSNCEINPTTFSFS